MAAAPAVLTCPECRAEFTGTGKRTFLGFTRFTCPACGKTVLNPLSNGYRITYWVLLVVTVGGFIINLLAGSLTLPGLVAAGVLMALIRDMELRSRLHGGPPPVT